MHLRQACEGDFRRLEPQRRAEVKLQYGRTTGIKARDGFMGLLVLQREVTGVVGDAKRAVDESFRGFFGA